MLTFKKFREANVTRCVKWHPEGLDSWSLSDWAVAMAGEAGEVCDVVKKLNRYRDGLPGNNKTVEELQEQLGEEIADTLTYLDLLAERAGLSLDVIVADKFNKVSERVGFPDRIILK